MSFRSATPLGRRYCSTWPPETHHPAQVNGRPRCAYCLRTPFGRKSLGATAAAVLRLPEPHTKEPDAPAHSAAHSQPPHSPPGHEQWGAAQARAHRDAQRLRASSSADGSLRLLRPSVRPTPNRNSTRKPAGGRSFLARKPPCVLQRNAGRDDGRRCCGGQKPCCLSPPSDFAKVCCRGPVMFDYGTRGNTNPSFKRSATKNVSCKIRGSSSTWHRSPAIPRPQPLLYKLPQHCRHRHPRTEKSS